MNISKNPNGVTTLISPNFYISPQDQLDAIISQYSDLTNDDADEYSYRCMWDGTGSGDADRMAMNCLRLSESECMAAQHGMKDARCIWRARSHYGMKMELDSLEADVAEESIIAGDTMVDLDAYDRVHEVEEESVPKTIGCLWDQTGCANGCDETAMVSRCALYNHDQETCEGEEGRNQRCVWGHGDRSQQELLDAYDREREVKDESISNNIGCLWDQTGCANGCDETAMVSRCALYNHDQETCEGEEGRNMRCVWGHGDRSQQKLAQFISGGAVGKEIIQMHALDVALGVVFMVSVGMLCLRLYRCWMKRGYIKLAEDPQDVEPLMMQQV